jgi:hypothetical protein
VTQEFFEVWPSLFFAWHSRQAATARGGRPLLNALPPSNNRNQDAGNHDQHYAHDHDVPQRTARDALPFRQSRAWTGHVLTYGQHARRAMFTLKVFILMAQKKQTRLGGRVILVWDVGGSGIGLSECPRACAPIRSAPIPLSLS